MSKHDNVELKKFLAFYPEKVQALFGWLRKFVWDHLPNCNELVYDNYNALAVGWSITDRAGHAICSIAAFSDYVHFGFYWGSEIADPQKLLLGKGKQYRYIVVREKKDFPIKYIEKLLVEAYANSLAKVKDKDKEASPTSLTIVKCTLPNKRRPGGPGGVKKKKSKSII